MTIKERVKQFIIKWSGHTISTLIPLYVGIIAAQLLVIVLYPPSWLTICNAGCAGFCTGLIIVMRVLKRFTPVLSDMKQMADDYKKLAERHLQAGAENYAMRQFLADNGVEMKITITDLETGAFTAQARPIGDDDRQDNNNITKH